MEKKNREGVMVVGSPNVASATAQNTSKTVLMFISLFMFQLQIMCMSSEVKDYSSHKIACILIYFLF